MVPGIDINADLGELPGSAGAGLDAAMLTLVTSASIACGGHAGDQASMLRVTREAAANGVSVGAHVSYPDREHFGRRTLSFTPDRLIAILREQVDDLMAAASVAGTAVRYIKAHGALYNASVVNDAPAGVLVELAQEYGLPVLTQADGRLAQCANSSGVEVYAEFFADRAYERTGLLRSRDAAGAVITDSGVVVSRVRTAVREGRVVSHDGASVRVEVHSVCVHSDTLGAVALVRTIRDALADSDLPVRPFVDQML